MKQTVENTMRSMIMKCMVIMLVMMAAVGVKGAKNSYASGVSNAEDLSVNGIWKTCYAQGKDENVYYKVIVPATGTLNVQVESHVGASCKWYVYSEDLTTWKAGYYWLANNETQGGTWVLSPGTYYVMMQLYSSAKGEYKVYAKFNAYTGLNDQNAVSFANPQMYTLGQKVVGALTHTDTADWYRFDIASNASYTLNISDETPGDARPYRVELYQTTLANQIHSGYNFGEGHAASIEKTLVPGTYYLKITPYNRYGKYQFVINRTPQSASNTAANSSSCSHNYKSRVIQPTYLSGGYTLYTCTKCSKTYQDNYTDKKVLSRGAWQSNYGRAKKSLKVTWSPVYDADGYQVRYSTNKKFKKNVKVKTYSAAKTSAKLKKLSRKKKYYVQVRAYKQTSSGRVYGKWSVKKLCRTK